MPGYSEKDYHFYIGPLEYIKKGKIYLRIPESSSRISEGQPLFAEQEKWKNQIIGRKKIKAKRIWYSHWELRDAEDAIKFINAVKDG